MKILMASTPDTGHLNPLIAVATFLIEDGHQVVFLSGTAYRDRIEKSGASNTINSALKICVWPAGII